MLFLGKPPSNKSMFLSRLQSSWFTEGVAGAESFNKTFQAGKIHSGSSFSYVPREIPLHPLKICLILERKA